MPLLPGARFGDFDVVRELGAGAMGTVYLVEDPRIERRVAIKTVRLRGDGTDDAAALRGRLAREAKAAGRLVHPHIVTLFEAGECEGLLYLAFEYIEGQDLATRMRQPPALSVAEVLRIAREAASGLAAAHRRGIVHRDIKPSNLLLNEEGVVKVADFGIAKLVAGQDADLTESGLLVGTPSYLSPEQIRGEPLDGRSDLFSLGVVIYHLLTHVRPFEGDTTSALVYQVLEHHPPLVSERRPDAPPRLAAAVAKLLAKDANDRFQSADALVDELTAIEREHVAEPARPDAESPMPAEAQLEPTIAATVVGHTPKPSATSRPDPHAGAAHTSAAPARRDSPIAALAIVIALLAAAGLAGLGFWWVGGADTNATARSAPDGSPGTVATAASPTPAPGQPDTPADRQVATPLDRADATPPVRPPPEPPAETPAATPPDAADARPPSRVVGRAVSFTVTPAGAAQVAVVKVDGLVRGPAARSVITLLPGRHQIEIVAAGYEPNVLLVESQAGVVETEPLPVAMRPSATSVR
jgi:serine/threonine protein kinase